MTDKTNQFQGVVESLLKGMDTVLSTKTVVGEATQIGDTIILPLVDVSFGVGAGAGTNDTKGTGSGAGGLGGKMTPSAVLVIKNGSTKLVNIKNQDTDLLLRKKKAMLLMMTPLISLSRKRKQILMRNSGSSHFLLQAAYHIVCSLFFLV